MRKNKLGTIIIAALSILLATSSINIYRNFQAKNKRETIKQNIINSENNDIKVIDSKVLVEKLNEVNKMITLTGETSITAKYSNKNISEDDVNFKWVRNFIEDLKSKDLNIDSVYSFSYIYDLKDIPIEIVNNIPVIHISKNRIDLTVELIENESYYSDRIGLLEDEFTPQEINSINGRTKELVYNKLINNKDNREKAIQSLKENLNKLLGYECEYIESGFDVVEGNNEITINK